MTFGAITRPAERERLPVKLTQIDWTFCLLLAAIASAGGLMLYSIGGGWSPWAWKHLALFVVCFLLMIALAMVDVRVWFAAAYPTYAVGLLLLLDFQQLSQRRDRRLG